ncbi:MAG: 16S rRNA (uracil(1498)-N(3))-methyltransferase [Candidatus Doudnabacteria bacterium]|nr:16S rRNA (uracil(1498)-N(3))-methyltransferase [Candidatus Doudnabacteria bacterium]
MPYFLSEQNLKIGQEVSIAGDEARHILLSHRIKVGEKIKLQGPDKQRFLCGVKHVLKNGLTVEPLERIELPKEPAVEIFLFQSAVSEKALDFIFQKSTELGVKNIILFNSARTATKLSPEIFKKKQQRWQKIITEAAKQSERAEVPVLEFLTGIDQVIKKAQNLDISCVMDITGNSKAVNKNIGSIGLVVGPEGGFDDSELEIFKQAKFSFLKIGDILLRAETAALAGVVAVRTSFGF